MYRLTIEIEIWQAATREWITVFKEYEGRHNREGVIAIVENTAGRLRSGAIFLPATADSPIS